MLAARVTLLLLAVSIAPTLADAQESAPKLTYAIAIHGGAGDWSSSTPEEFAAIRQDLKAALTKGRDILADGGSSLDAVEQTIRVLEDSPQFNAGKGATFNAKGQHQLDASIMRGDDLAAGAVSAVTVVKNPISLARRVMTDTKHVLLTAEGADAFARQIGVELVEPDYFWTAKTRAEWEAAKKEAAEKEATAKDAKRSSFSDPRLRNGLPTDHYGTVGCVALDQAGNLAAGTSTGGLMMKKFGRVGDSPIIGAGTYADNRACAVSCTGVGELFIRNAVAYDIAARIRYQNATLADAANVQTDSRLPKETAGLIALAPSGEIVAAFNTAAMPRGMADSGGRFEVFIQRDEPPIAK